LAEEPVAEPAAELAADAAARGAVEGAPEEMDETKKLLAQLTIGMVSEVVDERTFEIRDAAAKTGRKRIHIRLGNVAAPKKGAGPSEEQHQARVGESKAALEKLVGKQMIWWKAAPDEHQPPKPDDLEAAAVVIGDVWMIDGRHVNSMLAKLGHLEREELYNEELARDILTAEADVQKKKAYKDLEEALKESDKQKRKEAEERVKEEKMKPEYFGMAGWFGLGTLGMIVVAALCNFGRPAQKKNKNMNKKRGPCEKLWMKLKGA